MSKLRGVGARVSDLRGGFFDRHGVMHADMQDYLLAEVRAAYASGTLSLEELEKRTEAALRRDWQGAGFQFRPCRIERE